MVIRPEGRAGLRARTIRFHADQGTASVREKDDQCVS